MALLKQIKFGAVSTPIAMTQVAINADSDKVLSVVATHTDLGDENDPLYTLALAVDGKTITKTGDNGLATSLKLSYHAAVTTQGSEKGAYIALEDNTGASIVNSEIPVQDIIGNGILKDSGYDPATGILTLTFDNASGTDTKVEIDLGALFDFEDIVIKSNSTDYLGFEKVADGSNDTNQAQFEAKVHEMTASAGVRGTYSVTAEGVVSLDGEEAPSISGVVGLVDGADVASKVKTYIDAKVAAEAARTNAEISGAVKALDVTDAAVSGQFVDSVSETDGKISVSRSNVGEAVIAGFTADAAKTGAIVATDTISDALNKLQNKANAVQYKVDGTTLEFFGISEKTNA